MSSRPRGRGVRRGWGHPSRQVPVQAGGRLRQKARADLVLAQVL